MVLTRIATMLRVVATGYNGRSGNCPQMTKLKYYYPMVKSHTNS